MEDVSEWRLSTAGGIPYKLVSRSGSFSYEDSSATEEYIIQASDVLNFALEAFPEPIVIGSNLTYAPQPTMPGMGSLIPKRLSWKAFIDGMPIDPFGSDPGTDNYGDFVRKILKIF